MSMASPVVTQSAEGRLDDLHDTASASRNDRALALSLVATAAFYAYFCACSERPWDADSLVRSMYVQRTLHEPWRLLDPWARPLGIAPYLPVALLPIGVQTGFAVAKALSCAYSVLACLLLAMAVRSMNVGRPSVALVALACQPTFCEMSAGVDPATVFAAIFGLALWARAKGRTRAEVVCYSLLPLARFENVVLFAAVAFDLLRQRRPKLLLLLVTPTAAWYLIVAWLRSDLLWIVTYGREMAAWYPYSLDRNLQWHAESLVDPLHYFYLAPQIFGFVVVFLVVVRLVRQWDILILYLACMLGVHCFLKGIAGHAGYPRHVLSVAPLMGLFAAQGLAHLETGLGRAHTLAVRWGAVAVMAGTCLWLCRPLKFEQPETDIRHQAAQYLLREAPAAPYLTSQPWIDYFLDRNSCGHPRLNWANLDAASEGTYVLWDSTSAQADHQVKFEDISQNPMFRKVAEFPLPENGLTSLLDLFRPASPSPPKGYTVVLFKKVSQGSSRPN